MGSPKSIECQQRNGGGKNKEDQSKASSNWSTVKLVKAVEEAKRKSSNEVEGTSEYNEKGCRSVCARQLQAQNRNVCQNWLMKEIRGHFQQARGQQTDQQIRSPIGSIRPRSTISEPQETHSTTSYNKTTAEFEIEVEEGRKKKKNRNGRTLSTGRATG